jgi:hypothetical protein
MDQQAVLDMLTESTNMSELTKFVFDPAILDSGLLPYILMNPDIEHFVFPHHRIHRLAVVKVEDIPAVSSTIKRSSLYAYIVTSTRDIKYIHEVGCALHYALMFGLIIPGYEYDIQTAQNVPWLPCFLDSTCSDETCWIVVDTIFPHLHTKSVIAETLVTERPAVHYRLRQKYTEHETAYELASITKAEYFTLTKITESNVCLIFNYTPLLEVIEYIYANFNIAFLLSRNTVQRENDEYHDEQFIPESRQLGLLKYTLKHQPKQQMIMSGVTSIAEAELLVLFENLLVKEVPVNVLIYGSSTVIMRLQNSGYNLEQHEEYLERLRSIDV